MNLSIVVYNNKYYILKLLYYSYSSAILIKNGLSNLCEGVFDTSSNIYNYLYNENKNLYEIDPIKDNILLTNYKTILPSAPPMNLLNNITEYVMVEKVDLINLINNCNDKNLYNKYIIFT